MAHRLSEDQGQLFHLGSSNFSQSNARSLKSFESPLFLVAMSIIYGVLFMIFLVLNYEDHRNHPNSNSYTRFKYTRNQVHLGSAPSLASALVTVGSSSRRPGEGVLLA